MKNILCIEQPNNKSIQDTLSGLVSSALPLYNIENFLSVNDAVKRLQEKKQGVVLIAMEDMESEPFADLYNIIRFHPQVALIAVLPEAQYSFVQNAFAFGAHDVLARPLNSREMCSVILRQFERIRTVHEEVKRTMHDIAIKISTVLPHEFRTPLNGLIGFMSLLRQNALSEAEKPMAYQYLESSINRLHQTAEKFLLYAELEQIEIGDQVDSSSHHFATYGITSFVTELAHETLHMFNRLNDITFYLDDSEYAVQMRAQHVRFIIIELLTNACKFSPAHSPIFLTMKHDTTTCTLTVQDKGSGFDMSNVGKIGPFNQFGREQFEQQGVGFGLPIIRKILSLYSGSFDIQSKQNDGTSVTVVMPLAPLSQTEEGYASVQYISMHPLEAYSLSN
jgi:two-component system, sensor histidine kinase and response regulator